MESYQHYVKMLARSLADRCARINLDPEDLSQMAWEKAFRHSDQLRAETSEQICAWLRTLLARLLCDAERKFYAEKRGKGQVASLDETVQALTGTSVRLIELIPGPATTPSKALARKEDFHALHLALDSLPERERQAVELKDLGGLSLAETASRMGCTKEAVAGCLRRGRAKLRETMSPKK